jgi:hypothetical protein
LHQLVPVQVGLFGIFRSQAKKFEWQK